jgi:hypothetical protein
MPFEDLLWKSAVQRRSKKTRRSGERQDDGRRQERDGQPFDYRQNGTIYDQTDDEVDVIGG